MLVDKHFDKKACVVKPEGGQRNIVGSNKYLDEFNAFVNTKFYYKQIIYLIRSAYKRQSDRDKSKKAQIKKIPTITVDSPSVGGNSPSFKISRMNSSKKQRKSITMDFETKSGFVADNIERMKIKNEVEEIQMKIQMDNKFIEDDQSEDGDELGL
jgi:hypothetical protein